MVKEHWLVLNWSLCYDKGNCTERIYIVSSKYPFHIIPNSFSYEHWG